jgi:hypothetical protein
MLASGVKGRIKRFVGLVQRLRRNYSPALQKIAQGKIWRGWRRLNPPVFNSLQALPRV